MKQHYISALLFAILLTLCTPSVFGQKNDCNKQCSSYACVIEKVNCLLKQTQKNYGFILDNLDSAEGYVTDTNTKENSTLNKNKS